MTATVGSDHLGLTIGDWSFPMTPDSDPAPLLSVRNLSKSYGRHIGCRGVGFELWPGEVLGVVGESGSGKTTLLRHLVGLERPTSGTVRLLGHDITQMTELELYRFCRRFAILEDACCIPFSGHNPRFSRRASRDDDIRFLLLLGEGRTLRL